MNPGTRLALVTDDPAEAHRSPSEITVLADPAAVCRELATQVDVRPASTRPLFERPPAPEPASPLTGSHVLAALAERLPAQAIVLEESPTSRPDLNARLVIRQSLGLLSAAMGGLGFAMPAAVGLRMALPERPVLAIIGDGSSLYAIQALWSAARYRVGTLFIVMANGRYAIMDHLAQLNSGRPGPWPDFEGIDIAAMARALGCPAARVQTHDELVAQLDEVIPSLSERNQPLLLEIAVAP